MTLFAFLTIKSSISGINLPEAISIVALAALTAFFEFKNNEVKIIELQDKLNSQKDQLDELTQSVNKLAGFMTSQKLNTAFSKAQK